MPEEALHLQTRRRSGLQRYREWKEREISEGPRVGYLSSEWEGGHLVCE